MHIHGALGVSNLMALGGGGGAMALVDGPTEVHKFTMARQVLKQLQAARRRLAVAVQAPSARRRPPPLRRPGRPPYTRPAARRGFGSLLEGSPGNDADVKAMEAYLDATIGNL